MAAMPTSLVNSYWPQLQIFGLYLQKNKQCLGCSSDVTSFDLLSCLSFFASSIRTCFFHRLFLGLLGLLIYTFLHVTQTIIHTLTEAPHHIYAKYVFVSS